MGKNRRNGKNFRKLRGNKIMEYIDEEYWEYLFNLAKEYEDE